MKLFQIRKTDVRTSIMPDKDLDPIPTDQDYKVEYILFGFVFYAKTLNYKNEIEIGKNNKPGFKP